MKTQNRKIESFSKKPKVQKSSKTSLDGPWKYVLSNFLQQFMELCLPEIAKQIDWSKSYKKLNTEFEKRISDKKKLKRIADTVFEVSMKNSQKKIILLHLEAQGQKQTSFPKRMHEYNFLISTVVDLPVVSIAILLDKNLIWRPNLFERIDPFLKKPYLQFFYHVVKIADYEVKLNKKGKNIFSLAIRAQLAIMETKVEAEKLKIKLTLTKELLVLGLSTKQTTSLYQFIDWLIYLPNLMNEYNDQTNKLAEIYDAPYISTAQQVIIKSREEGLKKGRKEGIQKGRQEGEATLLSRLLKSRFPRAVTKKYIDLINKADSDTLTLWADKFVNAKSIQDVFSGEKPLHN